LPHDGREAPRCPRTAPVRRPGPPAAEDRVRGGKGGGGWGTQGLPHEDRPVRPLRPPAAGDSVAGAEGGGSWGNRGFPHDEDRPVRPLRHPAAASSVAAWRP